MKRLDTPDSSLPTPPRTRQSQLPTPETGRRSSRQASKLASSSAVSSTSLPTPETLPRKRKAGKEMKTVDPPSPSGHTTFFLSSTMASSSRNDGTLRRRPGLTFAQQMGLLSTSEKLSSSSRSAAGVGMGGARAISHKKDQIFPGRLAESLPVDEEENPFVVRGSAAAASITSPGRSTSHVPAGTFSQELRRSPRSKRDVLRSPPVLITDPVNSAVSLLSPPQTQGAQRIGTGTTSSSQSPAIRARQQREKQRQERLQTLRDEDDNPFLVKPGQRVIHRPGPVVDERGPTVTYVFRGAKKIFANPFIDPNIPVYGSNLHPDDDDFEPHPCPRPKLLWPTSTNSTSTPRRSQPASVAHSSRHSRPGLMSDHEASPPSSPLATPRGQDADPKFESDDEFLPEAGEEPELPVHRGLLFGAGGMKRESDGGTVSRRTRRRL